MNPNLDFPHIKDLQKIDHTDVNMFGRKALHLAMISRSGIVIPKGFCISAQMLQSIFGDVQHPVPNDNNPLSDNKPLNYIFEKANSTFGDWENNKKLVIRSSASLEDAIKASYAGIFRSEVDICNRLQFFDALKLCWESQYSQNVIKYILRIKNDISSLYLGIIIQEMIDGDVSGVIFTKNPMKPETNEILIEAYCGQCGPIVQGTVNPDRYYVDRGNCKSFRYDKSINFENLDAENGCLSDTILFMLANTSMQLEKIFSSPQDIEWTIKEQRLFVLQSRPITIGI